MLKKAEDNELRKFLRKKHFCYKKRKNNHKARPISLVKDSFSLKVDLKHGDSSLAKSSRLMPRRHPRFTQNAGICTCLQVANGEPFLCA